MKKQLIGLFILLMLISSTFQVLADNSIPDNKLPEDLNGDGKLTVKEFITFVRNRILSRLRISFDYKSSERGDNNSIPDPEVPEPSQSSGIGDNTSIPDTKIPLKPSSGGNNPNPSYDYDIVNGATSAQITAILESVVDGQTIRFEPGEYQIDKTKIKDKTNIMIEGNNAVLTAVDSDVNLQQLIGLYNCSNCQIRRLFIDGNKQNRIVFDPDTGKVLGQPSVRIMGGDNITISEVHAYNGPSDGIYLGNLYTNGGWRNIDSYPEDVMIQNCTFDENNRIGCTIVAGLRININDCSMKHNGYAQAGGGGSGIRCEANHPKRHLGETLPFRPIQDVVVTRCAMAENEHQGFHIAPCGKPTGTKIVDSTIQKFGRSAISAGTHIDLVNLYVNRDDRYEPDPNNQPGVIFVQNGARHDERTIINIEDLTFAVLPTEYRVFVESNRAGANTIIKSNVDLANSEYKGATVNCLI